MDLISSAGIRLYYNGLRAMLARPGDSLFSGAARQPALEGLRTQRPATYRSYLDSAYAQRCVGKIHSNLRRMFANDLSSCSVYPLAPIQLSL